VELSQDDITGFDELLGVELKEATGSRVVITCTVRPDLTQPYGILHGGVHCSLIESAASLGAALWFGERGNVVGVANHTNFLRATRDGTLTVTATPVQRGRTQQLWRVTVTNESGKDAATGEVRIVNIASADVLGNAPA